jgi:hypothetical protein
MPYYGLTPGAAVTEQRHAAAVMRVIPQLIVFFILHLLDCYYVMSVITSCLAAVDVTVHAGVPALAV